MNCDSRLWRSENGQWIDCPGHVTETVWCPTWIAAHDGPLRVCAECSKRFKPEFNPHAARGVFYWGDAARSEYEKMFPD